MLRHTIVLLGLVGLSWAVPAEAETGHPEDSQVPVVRHAVGQTLSAKSTRTGEVTLLDLPEPGLRNTSYTVSMKVKATGAPIELRLIADTASGEHRFGPLKISDQNQPTVSFATSSPGGSPIQRIRIAANIPENAGVELSRVQVVQHWLDARQSDLVTGIVATLVTALVLAVGVLTVLRKATSAAKRLQITGLIFTSLCLALGTAASFLHQPAGLYYPVAMSGLIGLPLLAILGRFLRRGISPAEERRMLALDL